MYNCVMNNRRHSTTGTEYGTGRRFRLPRVGQRITKTSVAVLICLVGGFFRKRKGATH